MNGGVGSTSPTSVISIRGGKFIDNWAGNAGGGFALERDTSIQVRIQTEGRKGGREEGECRGRIGMCRGDDGVSE